MAKRINGEGSIRKRSDGRWEARYFDIELQKQRSLYGKTRKEVVEKLREKQRDMDSGIIISKGDMTVAEWMMLWLKSYNTNVKPTTFDSYVSIINNHINPYLGDIKLCNICTQHIQDLYNYIVAPEEGQSLSVKTLKNIHGVMHKAMEKAVEVCYIKRNPASACVIPKCRKREIMAMDGDMAKEFIRLIKEDVYADIFFVTLFTGMRQGEICGLKWDCVDFERGVIIIKRQLQRRKHQGAIYYLTTTKNDKERIITPAPIVMNVLKKVKEKQNVMRLKAGTRWNKEPEWDNLVFTNEYGRYCIPNTIYRHYKRIVGKMEENYLRFHDLRHSFAVLSLENGDDIKVIQETLGHYSAAFTMDTYSHVTKLMRQRSADKMQAYIDSIDEKVG